MRNTTRSHIYLPIAAMIVTAPLAVPAAVQNRSWGLIHAAPRYQRAG
jgi:hypothetical protein